MKRGWRHSTLCSRNQLSQTCQCRFYWLILIPLRDAHFGSAEKAAPLLRFSFSASFAPSTRAAIAGAGGDLREHVDLAGRGPRRVFLSHERTEPNFFLFVSNSDDLQPTSDGLALLALASNLLAMVSNLLAGALQAKKCGSRLWHVVRSVPRTAEGWF